MKIELPDGITMIELRAMAECAGLVPVTRGISIVFEVPGNLCVRPAKADVISIASLQHRQSPQEFAARFAKWAMSDNDGPSAA